MAHADHARPPGDNDQAGARVSARGQEAADILERGEGEGEAHLWEVTSWPRATTLNTNTARLAIVPRHWVTTRRCKLWIDPTCQNVD